MDVSAFLGMGPLFLNVLNHGRHQVLGMEAILCSQTKKVVQHGISDNTKSEKKSGRTTPWTSVGFGHGHPALKGTRPWTSIGLGHGRSVLKSFG